VQDAIKRYEVGAVMAVPASINGVIEGFACFESFKDRVWLPFEIEEAKHVLDGYSRSVERRIEDRNQIAEEFHLRRSEEQYRLLTEHSPVILFGIDSEGKFTLSEGLGLKSMGAGGGEVVGKSVYQVYRNYPDILEQVNTALSGVESHGLTHIGDKCFEVWFTPVCDDDRIVVGLSGVAVDITRRNILEQQQTIMMSELDHRVKNNIAAVMSLVGLSQQGARSIEEFAKTLNGRLHALAVAHSTLAKSHWKGVWMRDILLLTLQPYMVGTIERIRFDGPDVELPGTLARPMCMVIHELATNATKYGALSSDDGFVVVTTDVQSKDGSIQLTWVESDGPTILSEIMEGTGTSLLQGLVDHEMHGKITMNYASEGLVCQIEVPLDTNS
jgi:PAS domain S-box-containing protein